MWSLDDCPTYGLFASYVTKRHVGCSTCEPTIESWFPRKMMKILNIVGINDIHLEAILIGELALLSMGKQNSDLNCLKYYIMGD
jgi:hypothetical protein